MKETDVMTAYISTEGDALTALFSDKVNIASIINKINWKGTMASINQKNLPIIPLAQFIFEDQDKETGMKAIFNYCDNNLTFIMPQATFDKTTQEQHIAKIEAIFLKLHSLSKSLLKTETLENPLTFIIKGDNSNTKKIEIKTEQVSKDSTHLMTGHAPQRPTSSPPHRSQTGGYCCLFPFSSSFLRQPGSSNGSADHTHPAKNNSRPL